MSETSGVTGEGDGEWWTTLGDTLEGGDTRIKLKMWLNLERTVVTRGRTAKKGNHFAYGDFQEKIWVTPSVTASGDINPSNATE